VIWIVSLLTAPPPQAIQELVADVRYPQVGKRPAAAVTGSGSTLS
jgi:hypothetical protein